MKPNIINAVVAEFRRRGRTAYNEHPGFVHVVNADGTGFWTSDCNDTWTVNLMTADGDAVLDGWNTGIRRDCEDAVRIVDAVDAIIAGWTAAGGNL